ncbi:MAG: periplasmic heavy metal sensor [Rhodobacteraceae bacterium]|nr:periplasmic heavy metal sensor [Paracoccaceae bacterium]
MAESGSGNCRGLRWALIASVTLNLLVVGVITGGIIGHDRHPPRPVVGDVTLGAFTNALSKEDREALRKAAQKRGSAFRDMRRQSRADMAALITALKADPWNRAEVEQIFARHQSRISSRVLIGDALIFERIDAMSPTRRQEFAQRLSEDAKRLEKRKDRDDKEDRKDPPPLQGEPD